MARTGDKNRGRTTQGKSAWRRHRADSGQQSPPRFSCARSPSTASTISSPIPAPTSRRSSRPSARAQADQRQAAAARCWCRTRTSRSRWRTAPTCMTGRPQAVMVHVNVGTGNTINNLINLARDRVPLILAAGRTPITEKGSFGSRSRQIHWAPGDVRPGRHGARAGEMGLRAARAGPDRRRGRARASKSRWRTPRGPVYLVLPREPLSASLTEPIAPIKPRPQAAPAHPDPRSDRKLADWIAAGRAAADHHRGPCTGRGGRGARARSPSAAPSRSSRTMRARCACRRAPDAFRLRARRAV